MMNGNGQAKDKEPVDKIVDLFVHMPIGFAVMAWKRVPEFVGSVPGLVGEALSKGCAGVAQAEERLSEEVRKARMIGQVAVTFGGRQLRREVDSRLRDARQAAEGVAGSFIPGAGGETAPNGATAAPASAAPAPAAPSAPSAAAAAAPPAPKAAPPPAKPAGARPATKAPAKKAAKPAASSAAPAKTADPPARAADLPIREYDGLSASQVVSRLTGLTPDELQAVHEYESANRGRRTVLLAIDRLLG